MKITGLHAFKSKAKAVQNSRFALSFAQCANIVQRNIFAYTFEPSANDPQIHGCPLSLHQDVNVVQMWHLPSLLRIANLVQYQSLLLRKIVQMWYLLHICCNLATLVNPFFRPV